MSPVPYSVIARVRWIMVEKEKMLRVYIRFQKAGFNLFSNIQVTSEKMSLNCS